MLSARPYVRFFWLAASPVRRRPRRRTPFWPDRPATRTLRQTPSRQPQSGKRLRDDLSKAGFTDITIMPSSFLVRAKDSQGNPVMMVINPDSITEVTEQSEQPMSGAIKGEPNSPIPAPPPKSTTPPAKQ